MSKRSRRLAVVVESLAAGGDGVARDESGRVTFVPRSAPGDRLLVTLVQERKQFARAKIAEILEASPLRVEARCSLFAEGQCGGCQWQHVDSAAQRAAKQENVEQALRRAIGRGTRCESMLEPCRPWNWRRRARFSYWGGGPKVLGFFPQGEHRKITDVVSCPQLEEGLQQGLDAIRTHLLPGLSARGEVSAVLGRGGRVHVSVKGSASRQSVESLAAEAVIAGVTHGNRSYGEPSIELEEGGTARGDSFAQASSAGNLALRSVVASFIGDLGGKRVLELFAGSGNFTGLLADAAEVVAVESAETARDHSPHVRWVQGDAASVCDSLAAAGESFDVVLLDPPRRGAREVLESIVKLGPGRIVYVSCDVATLARDVDSLCALGYVAKVAQPVDLMPQTAQVEVVVSLEREPRQGTS